MAPLMLPGARPMAFGVVAVTGGYPSATSTGNVTSVPEPTTVLIIPAQTPAKVIRTACHQIMPHSRRLTIGTSRDGVTVRAARGGRCHGPFGHCRSSNAFRLPLTGQYMATRRCTRRQQCVYDAA